MAHTKHNGTITGTVKRKTDQGFGFIPGTDGVEYFFHRSAVFAYDDLDEGDALQFIPGVGDKKPRAEHVERTA